MVKSEIDFFKISSENESQQHLSPISELQIIQRSDKSLKQTWAILDSDRINVDVRGGRLEWWKGWLKSRNIKRFKKDCWLWKVYRLINIAVVFNPLASWQGSLYLASLSLIPSSSLFTRSVLLFLSGLPHAARLSFFTGRKSWDRKQMRWALERFGMRPARIIFNWGI